MDGEGFSCGEADAGDFGDIAGVLVYPVHLEEVFVACDDGDAELLGVDFGEIDVSPVGAAEGAGDDGLSPGFGDCRAVGGCHFDHKPAVRVVRAFQTVDDELLRSNPDVFVGDVVGAVDVGRCVFGQGDAQQGAVCVQADEEIVPCEGRTVSDEGFLAVSGCEGFPFSALPVREGAELLGDEAEVRPAE